MMLKIFMVLLVFINFGVLHAKNCVDKSQKSTTPEGLNEIPVTLALSIMGNEATLPCHYCDQRPGITGRVWKRKNLHGKIMTVKLDMHDDDDKNRVFVNKEHSLVIKDVRKSDAAYYFCYDTEAKDDKAKIEILLDVITQSTLEPEVLKNPVDLKTAIPPLLKECDKLKSIKSMKDFQCYAEWSQWSQCDVCGKLGQRRRVGKCRLQKLAKAKLKTPEGKEAEAEFPIIGVGCNSYLLDAVPEAKIILSKIPNIALIENCEVSCEDYIGTVTEMTAHKKNSFLKKIKMKSIKAMKGVKAAIVTNIMKVKEGKTIALFCPGSTIDTPIRWKYYNKEINPKKIKQKSKGRITIDATDVLHMRKIRPVDSGEYICTLYGVEIGLIRLKVQSIFIPFDITTNFGILTISLALTFLLYLGFMIIKCRSYRMQKKVQKLRIHRTKAQNKAKNKEERRGLLLTDDGD